VKLPAANVPEAKFSYVDTKQEPWQLWCNRDASDFRRITWFINVKKNGKWVIHQARNVHEDDGHGVSMQVLIEPDRISLTSQKVYDRKTLATLEHDPYPAQAVFRFGSVQEQEGGAEVVTDFEAVFVNGEPYHYDPKEIPDGPEDVHPQDRALSGPVVKATPWNARIGEGDLIVLNDGSWLLVSADWYTEAGWDRSASRIIAMRSEDGGETWSKPWTVVQSQEPPGWTLNKAMSQSGYGINVRHVSLVRANNGDLLMAHVDKMADEPWAETPGREPGTKAEGLVLRRSRDEGRTWGPAMRMTPKTGNYHLANNACFRKLASGRLVLSCREYVREEIPGVGRRRIRWPYCLYSDDNGNTWRAGRHVPDAGLTGQAYFGQNVNEPSVAALSDGRLLTTMRSIAGGQFFAYSHDEGETWTKPYLSPLRGSCSPATIRRIPGSNDVLALWSYGFHGRRPVVSAVSSDGGTTWKHLKLVEQSLGHSYCYASMTFAGDRVVLTYYEYPSISAVRRFDVMPSYEDLQMTVLPIKWFYRDVNR